MKKFNDKKNMMAFSTDNKIELQGIFEIEKTRANFMSFLETLGYDLSEKDLTQTNQSPNRELTVFVDGQRVIDDYFAAWISFKLSMKGSDVEIVEDGKKVIKTKGSAQLIISAYLEEDPYKKEPSEGFAKFWFALFNKFHHEHMWSDAIITAAGDKGQAVKFFKNQVGTKL
jgi:hypothetical protein